MIDASMRMGDMPSGNRSACPVCDHFGKRLTNPKWRRLGFTETHRVLLDDLLQRLREHIAGPDCKNRLK